MAEIQTCIPQGSQQASKDSRLDSTEIYSCQEKWGTLGYTPKLPLTSLHIQHPDPLAMIRKKDPGRRPSCIHILASLDRGGFWNCSLSLPFLRKVH